MGLLRHRDPTDPREQVRAALRAEHVPAGMYDPQLVLTNWQDLNALCPLSARDFVRTLMHRPTQVDPARLDEAAREITALRGQPAPAHWTAAQAAAHHERFLNAVDTGGSLEQAEQVLDEMPAVPANVHMLLLDLLVDLAPDAPTLAQMLPTATGASHDHIVDQARTLLRLACTGNLDKLSGALRPICATAPQDPTSGALLGLLAALVYRQRTPTHRGP